jgi:hypothetical protein
MNCTDFRARLGAEPQVSDAELEAHRSGCAACADYARELAALDARLRTALEVPVPVFVARPAPGNRVRWSYALAAAAVLAAVIVAGLFAAFPRESLAAAVADHAAHEPGSWTAPGPADSAELQYVLGRSHVALEAGGPSVSYAQSCWFRGHFVPHLVVAAEHGPVTVMVLPEVRVGRATPIDEQGFHGVIVPARRGALAVLSQRGEAALDVDAVAAAVAARIRYLD